MSFVIIIPIFYFRQHAKKNMI